MINKLQQIKNEKSTVSCNLLDSFSDAVTTIESYHNTREFNGSPDMFFALVEKCLPYRPVSCLHKHQCIIVYCVVLLSFYHANY